MEILRNDRRKYDPAVDSHGDRITRTEERLESLKVSVRDIEQSISGINESMVRVSDSLSVIKGVAITITTMLGVCVPILIYVISHVVFK